MIFIKQSQNEQEDEGFTFYFFLIFFRTSNMDRIILDRIKEA